METGRFPAGLYNATHAVHDDSDLLMEWLGINQPDSHFTAGRYRDCWLTEDGDRIIVFTRNGGDQRARYQTVLDELKTHPCWVRDWDDDFDSTYCYIEFEVPVEHRGQAKELAPGVREPSLREKTESVFTQIRGGGSG